MERIFGKKSSIQRKVVVVYLLIGVLPLIIITLSASAIYYRSILKGAYGLVEQNARLHETVVQERMSAYENVLYELITKKDYIQLSTDINTGDENSLLVDAAHMETLLRSCVYTYDGIRSITFLADSGRYVTYSKWYGSMNESIWSEQEHRKKIYDEIEKSQKLTFIATVNLSNSSQKDDYVILMGYPVKNLRTKEQSGVLVMALEDDVLLFDESRTDQRREEAYSGVTTVIADDHDKILAGVEPDYVNEGIQDYLNGEFGGRRGISENRRRIQGTEWTIVNIIDTAVYQKEIYHFIRIVLVLMVAITCLFFVILFFISNKYIGAIRKIAQNIHDFKGTDADQIITDLREEDELYVIVRQFNTMTARVNSLVETLRQRNEEIKAAAISQKHAEIKALEAQINPHFLFNILDSINWRAIEHDEEEISSMLGTLGSLLRYSVSNIDMKVVLEAEISWLEKYVFLQRDRFQDSFDCQYEITDEAMQFPIYKMLLQPIIENAILHAFEDVKEGGMIHVKAFVRTDGKLEIRIRDNGCGMKEETLFEIQREISEKGALNSESIGISNCLHRLRIYYQDEAGIIVKSKYGEGTEFILIIPDKQEGKLYR
ncbi:sensor histidine kinase [Lachnospiraceae bacterium 54-53]